MSRRGHVWHTIEVDPVRPYASVRVTMHLAGTHPDDCVEALPPVSADVCECQACGLVGASAGRVSAYGLDLDSLAVMGSAPACRPLMMGGPS